MRVINILHDSIVDGKGLRTVIFFSGCPHHCLGCQNPQSWNPKNGVEITEVELFQEVIGNELSHVTFSGGEPFMQSTKIAPFAKRLKQHGKNIWTYTGYLFEELIDHPEHQPFLEQIDVLVDGRFELAKRDLALLYKGSSNQRIIDVPKSLKARKVILFLE